jgi:hypothetical protein
LGLKSLNWTKAAPPATRRAKTMRPAREAGVVLGSEIMKKANMSRAPLSNWWRGMAKGSPSHAARRKTRPA